jgi:tetratricopeptide (TPR) repeat protein
LILSGVLTAWSAAATKPTPASESVEARREAYLCTSQSREVAIPACRRALALGLRRDRATTVNLVLGLHLAALQRWDEVVKVYREAVRLSPHDAIARWRLGDALLYGLGRPTEARAPLREATRLDPSLAGAYVSLGVAQNAMGDHAEAVASFDEALRLEPRVLATRPVAREVLKASRRGERWTP